MKKLVIATVLLSLAGCSGLMQAGSVAEAHKSYERQKYAKTLTLISRAESLGAITPRLEAKIAYLKAQTYERMGEAKTAATLYAYLRDQHSDSQYGYLAARRLGASDAAN